MLRTPAAWPLWRESRHTIALILAVELSALLVPVISWVPISSTDIAVTAGLASLSIAYSVITCRAERARWGLHQGVDTVKYQNLLAVWGFAGAVLLPLPLTWLLAIAAAIAEWPARNVAGHARLYRHVYSTAGAILAAAGAHAVSRVVTPTWLGIAAAALAYMILGILAIAVAMIAAGEREGARGLLQLRAHHVEVCSLAMASGLVALVIYHFPMLVWLSLPAAIGLQRFTTRSRLRRVTVDAQLRPMSEEAWFIAAREVVLALPAVSIMRIDTNAPAAVSAVAHLQIGCDAIGYLGANGLGMLLVDCPALNAESLAARLRTALREKGISAGVAAAGKPRDGYSLDDLLAVCEAELIAREAARRSADSPRPDL